MPEIMSCDLNSWYLLRRELSSVCPNKEGNAGYTHMVWEPELEKLLIWQQCCEQQGVKSQTTTFDVFSIRNTL